MKEIITLLNEPELSNLVELYNESGKSEKNEILSFLIDRDYDKVLWESSAKFINTIDSNELRGFEKNLFVWLQDLNWPGFKLIIQVLSNLPLKVIGKVTNETIKQIREEDDELWLAGIKVLCNENEELINLIDEENKPELEKIDWI